MASEIQNETNLLSALRKEYQGSLIYKQDDFFVVKERNCETKKHDFHLFGISEKHHGFICTFPSLKITLAFVNQISKEERMDA